MAISGLENGEDTDAMGMRSDIIQAVDRRMDLFALLSSKRQMGRRFVAWAYEEARKKRKRPVFLAPFKDIDWIHSAILEESGEDKGSSGVACIGKGSMNCVHDGSYIDPSDVLNHCFREGTIESCPGLAGFDLPTYREVKKSGGSQLSALHDVMKEKGMCPARTSMDLASESEAIVTHYSFLFTEDWKNVMEFLGLKGAQSVLIIFDPAAFISFLRKRLTYSLSTRDLERENWDLSMLGEEERKGVEIVLELLADIATRTDPKKQIGRRLLLEGFRERAEGKMLRTNLANSVASVKSVLDRSTFKTISERRRFRDLYLLLKNWMGHYSGVSRVRREDQEGDLIELQVVDLSIFTTPVISMFSSLLLFGDNLYPHSIYSYILGVRSEKVVNRTYVDNRKMGNTKVITLGNVDTSFKHRSDSSYMRIAENLSSISEMSHGLKLAIFPSYFLMERTMEAMTGMGFTHPVVEESRGMTRDDRSELVSEIKVSGDLLALTVQGGHLMRSMEEGSISPDNVILVGLHIPPPDPASNQMKVHHQKKYGTNIGHVISVLMPAITQVMRVVNGMVSEDVDRMNVVTLMDRRYQDRRILECLPRFYDLKLLNGPKEFDPGKVFPGGGPL